MLRALTTRRVVIALSAVTLGAFVATTVDARPGRSGNVGSRGERTQSAPPPTATAPRPAQQMDRSVTQPAQARPAAPAAAPAAQQAARPGMATGLMGGFAMGLVGAGLFGMLSGQGFFSGLGSMAGILGFLLQLVLIGGLIFLVMRFFRARREAPAMPGAPSHARMAQATAAAGPGHGGGLGAAAVARNPHPPAAAVPSDTIGIQPNDYQAFEQLLGAVQAGYGRMDVASLRTMTTPEMAAYFEGELADLHARGLAPRISDVRLLQGDLAEAWREGPVEYATVAMRYSIRDEVVERATGRPVDGQPTPVEATELWTFLREPRTGRRWVLSAIQQAG